MTNLIVWLLCHSGLDPESINIIMLWMPVEDPASSGNQICPLRLTVTPKFFRGDKCHIVVYFILGPIDDHFVRSQNPYDLSPLICFIELKKDG